MALLNVCGLVDKDEAGWWPTSTPSSLCEHMVGRRRYRNVERNEFGEGGWGQSEQSRAVAQWCAA